MIEFVYESSNIDLFNLLFFYEMAEFFFIKENEMMYSMCFQKQLIPKTMNKILIFFNIDIQHTIGQITLDFLLFSYDVKNCHYISFIDLYVIKS